MSHDHSFKKKPQNDGLNKWSQFINKINNSKYSQANTIKLYIPLNVTLHKMLLGNSKGR